MATPSRSPDPRADVISVVVPARNEERNLARCMEALLSQEGLSVPMEIIVVDDASSDDTSAIARSFVREGAVAVRLVNGPGRGVSAARNAGAREARGSVILFTDADCRPVPEWAAALDSAVRRDGVSGATGRQASSQAAPVARAVQAEYEEKQERLLRSRRVTFADTATVAYRGDAFHASGGFDEALRNFEDTELAFRLAEAGHRIEVVPEAVVHHRHVESLGAYARRKFRIGYWGAAVFAEYPDRMGDDSRTPWSMRLQMVLAPVAILGLLAAPLHRAGPAVAAAAGAGFVVSGLPFVRRAARLGAAAGLIAPLVLLVRALALDLGLSAGLARLALGSHPGLAARRRAP